MLAPPIDKEGCAVWGGMSIRERGWNLRIVKIK